MQKLTREEMKAHEAFKVNDIVRYHAPDLHGSRKIKRRIGRVVGFSRDQWGVRVLFERCAAAVREDMEHLVLVGHDDGTNDVHRERRAFSKQQGRDWLVWIEDVPVGDDSYRSPTIRISVSDGNLLVSVGDEESVMFSLLALPKFRRALAHLERSSR